MRRTTIDFGIDLGTTNSTIAVIDGADAKVIPNRVGSAITPSAVWIDRRGNLLVGEEAKKRALGEDQDNGDIEFKLRMGDGQKGAKVFVRSGRAMLPEELSAEVLKELRRDVRTSMGEEIQAAVITVPAAFENPATAATRRAAELAGISLSPLLLEPVAASLAYGFDSENENVYWLVYDFGGGTFDAAVMRIRDGIIHVEKHNGDNFLGGKLLDWDIVTTKLMPAAMAQFNLPDFRRGNERWAQPIANMKYQAELAKIDVCRSRTPKEIYIDGFEDADGKAVDFAYTLTQQDVEQISSPYIERSLRLCRKTLEEAGLDASAMDRILMVGGSTLNPWVRDAVQAELRSRLEFGIDPVTVVARGAAIFASTKENPLAPEGPVAKGEWRVKTEYNPVGNVCDPDVGGRVLAPNGQNLTGFTIELVDARTRWRSGRIPLRADGVFMTQLYVETARRCDYAIELCDPTGKRIPTAPGEIPYTYRKVISDPHPPAANTIGVGLANGVVAVYFEKGAKLPDRQTRDHTTVVPLRAGHVEDELRIPLLEGEHARAERNHGIGALVINGSDLPRDLPAQSQVEIELIMDESQQITMRIYINALDLDFEKKFEPEMQHGSLKELREEAQTQKERLAKASTEVRRTGARDAEPVLSQIKNEQLVEQIDKLLDAAASDPDALAQLDRRLRELAAVLDTVEDQVEWPALREKAEDTRKRVKELVDELGNDDDKKRWRSLQDELQKAVTARKDGGGDLLRRVIDELNGLAWTVLDRRPAAHVAIFEDLVKSKGSMRDPAQADQIIAKARRAVQNSDVDGLRAANRQLLSLLPRDVQAQVKHKNVGGVI